MLKKFFNRLIKNQDTKVNEEKNEEIDELKVKEICITDEEIVSEDEAVKEIQVDVDVEEGIETIEQQLTKLQLESELVKQDILNENSVELNCESLSNENEEEYVKVIKIKRGKSIKAIDVYTEEEIIFKTHKECSRKIKVPLDYIIENLKYGYTDYLGNAINYLSKELQLNEDYNYLESNKTPIEIFNNLHNRIFSIKISDKRRDEILSSENIEPIKMHYKFECIDEEYDEYFEKYKSIIKRGGKKKIELVDKKGEAIERFRSLDECANFLGKEKDEVVDMLKYMNNKVGRHEIRYSLRNI